MTDEQDVLALFDLPFGLAVNLTHQWAGGVDIQHLAPFGFCRDRFGHSMRAEHDRCVVRHLVEFLDEDRALRLQAVDDITIVHDFMPDIDRGTVFLQRTLDDLDGAVDPCTEAARRRDQELEGQARIVSAGAGRGWKGGIHVPPSSAFAQAKLGRPAA